MGQGCRAALCDGLTTLIQTKPAEVSTCSVWAHVCVFTCMSICVSLCMCVCVCYIVAVIVAQMENPIDDVWDMALCP